MKAKLVALLVLPSLLLSSCSFLFGVQSTEKEIAVYDIDRLDADNNLSSGLQTTVRARFVSGQDYIPYLTIGQYASLYDRHLGEGFVSTIEKSSFATIWTIEKEGEPYFVCIADYFSGEFTVAGSIENTYGENDDPRDLKALEYGMETEQEGKYLSEKSYATYKFTGYSFTHFNSGREHYYPLGLLDITFSNNSSIYFTYNYSHIFSTRDVDNYSTLEFTDNGNKFTFDSQMEANVNDASLPSYLRDYNSNLFIYLMDNFYGLKDNKGIKSMAQYYKGLGLYSNLFSSDRVERTWAFSDALSILDDNHTILVSTNGAWDNAGYRASRRYGEGCFNRSELRKELVGYRNDAYLSNNATIERDIIYSADNKTALFSFDSFVFGSSDQVFNDGGTIKDTAKTYDTFFKLIDVIQRVKEHGNVENIIFDVSLNGGGTVGIMMKLLGLMSKDNSSYLAFYEDTTSILVTYDTKIDINNDGVYDTSDCFGDEFNFYILTSDYSFSCANAFPCIAQVKNYAKIIGQKSGGGECAVAIHYLPNSEYVYHSSNLHLGYFDEQQNVFKGFESGATPDISVPVGANFYSIEYLNGAIANAQ